MRRQTRFRESTVGWQEGAQSQIGLCNENVRCAKRATLTLEYRVEVVHIATLPFQPIHRYEQIQLQNRHICASDNAPKITSHRGMHHKNYSASIFHD